MKIQTIAALAATLAACMYSCGNRPAQNAQTGPGPAARPQFIRAVSPAAGERFRTGDEVLLIATLEEGVTPDSAFISLDSRRAALGDDHTLLYRIAPGARVGRIPWHAVVYAGGDSSVRYSEMVVYPKEAPRQYTYRIKKSYPHDTTSYTQGLLWYEGFLYESTGMKGQSRLLKVRLETGRAVQSHKLEDAYFGEGLALFGERLYQLTWQDGVAFVYDLLSFEPAGQFSYAGEGWGLASDGESLYMSDGTERIRVLDPKTLRVRHTLIVCTDRVPVAYLNELEWIEGELWANVYTTSQIVRIDPQTGRVKGVIELTGILPDEDISAETDVMNGIAYDPGARRIFVTGKNWPKLFEIEVFEK